MRIFLTLTLFLLAVLSAQQAEALLVTYTGTEGLSATADFSLTNGGNNLVVLITNTSNVAAMTTAGINGDAKMVLSSINFDLGSTLITGGTAELGTNGRVIASTNTTAWGNFAGAYDLDDEYGYTNIGVGNTPGPVLIGALNAVTSHSNGGNNVTTFDGVVGGVGNGLDWGLVTTNTLDIGNGRPFILNSIKITLNLSAALATLDFLNDGTYVEFGSDYQYVPGTPEIPDDPDEPVIPEPATLSLIGLGLGLAGLRRARR